MKVLKAINNNVVSCLDDNGKELVVMGKGLGFHAKPGNTLSTDAVEKIFRMDSPEEFSRMKRLFASLPPELLELCSRIIDYAGQVLDRRLNESIYLTLTDHIQFAIERCRQGLFLHNALETEVRVFYPEEYTIGVYALQQIASGMNVTLPEDEAASIALHLVNAEYDRSMNNTMRAAQALQPIVQILEQFPGLPFNKHSLYYDELIVHLKFLAMQAFSREAMDWSHPSFADSVKAEVPVAYACAEAVTDYLTAQSGNTVSDAEQAYLALCIHRASYE